MKGAIREAKDAASMINNINYKLNHDTWLYNDLPDGTFIGSRRIVASGDKTRINKLVDNFGRIIDETKETSRVSSEN